MLPLRVVEPAANDEVAGRLALVVPVDLTNNGQHTKRLLQGVGGRQGGIVAGENGTLRAPVAQIVAPPPPPSHGALAARPVAHARRSEGAAHARAQPGGGSPEQGNRRTRAPGAPRATASRALRLAAASRALRPAAHAARQARQQAAARAAGAAGEGRPRRPAPPMAAVTILANERVPNERVPNI